MADDAGSELVRQSSRAEVQHPDVGTLDPDGVQELKRQYTKQHENDPESGEFDFDSFLRATIRVNEEHNIRERTLGFAFDNVSVYGSGAGAKHADTVGSLLAAPLFLPKTIAEARKHSKTPIIHNFSGSVNPGEMLLVLGRPGSGCSSLLRTIANDTGGFTSIEGERSFSGLKPKAFSTTHTGESIYLPEDDIHLPTLTVGQTLDFVAKLRAPAKKGRVGSRDEYAEKAVDVVMTLLGLKHTVNTKVGNEFVRGVSGGERKRVSIAELLLSRARIGCHDNSTRGLDSSTAVQYGQCLRIATDILQTTTVLSIYQTGEQLYQLFDKVAVMYAGYCIYFGPMNEAVKYFWDMGYQPLDRQTSADFVVQVTDEMSRVIRPGFENKVPRTPRQFFEYFKNSPQGSANDAEVKGTLKRHQEEGPDDFKVAAKKDRVSLTSPTSPFLVSYFMMLKLCFRRRFQMLLGDLATPGIMVFAIVLQSLIIGSMYYHIPKQSGGFFSRGGVMFFAILFNSFMSMSEIPSSFAQRPVLVRQRRYGICRPSADFIAHCFVSLPMQAVNVLVFDLVVYFIPYLWYSADNWFVFLLFTWLGVLSMTMGYRFIASISSTDAIASLMGGIYTFAVAIYAGYVVPRPSMRVWNRWISYAQPVPFAFEAIMTNEFRKLDVPCTPASLVPQGPGYENVTIANQVCSGVTGSQPGQSIVSGAAYLQSSYGYKWSHTWRNFGFILAYLFTYMFAAALATEFQKNIGNGGSVITFIRNKRTKNLELLAAKAGADQDAAAKLQHGDPEAPAADEEKGPEEEAVIEPNEDIFTWEDVSYDVQIKSETRRLLDHVYGYVVPGKLTALMGESGAGKTTLLNTLAQRNDSGTVYGDILVNGKPLPSSFGRKTGYVQQLDTHLESATVGEAVLFSAILRLPRSVSKEEKEAHVKDVMRLLELDGIADAVVGEVGSGLNVEQRKRLTIAVELAAKPELLLFLDEPTSGLDSQSAYNITLLLRRLADHGQAILATIHQPSGQLFNLFDRLLLLKKGGQTVYFGETGQNSLTMIEYFERQGARKAGETENPAEYILDVIGAGATAQADRDWGKLWKQSPEAAQIKQDIVGFKEKMKDHVSKADQDPDSNRTYAAPLITQVLAVTRRTSQNYYRSSSYMLGKLMLGAFGGLFIGLSMWKAPETQQGLQLKLFAAFMSIVIVVPMAQQQMPRVIHIRSIYDVLERHSRMYRWWMVPLSIIISEQPWQVITTSLFMFTFYWSVDFPTNPMSVGYYYLVQIMYYTYWISFSTLIGLLAPTGEGASVLFSTLYSFCISFNGVVQPVNLMPYFWRVWMYRLTPLTYFVDSLVSNFVSGVPVNCEEKEFSKINVPDGMTCNQYLDSFTNSAPGYAQTLSDGSCGYCPYKVGDEYLSTVGMSASHRWRNFGFFWAYIVFNWGALFVIAYLIRYNSWGSKVHYSKDPAPDNVTSVGGFQGGSEDSEVSNEKVSNEKKEEV